MTAPRSFVPPPTASLGQYLRFLWRRKFSIMLPVMVAAGVAYGLASRQEPTYESFTDLLFSASGPGAADAARPVSIPTEARVATSPAVLAAAAERLDPLAAGASSLQGAVEAEQAGDIAVLRITARHGSATVAADIARAVSETYLAERDRRTQEAMAAGSAEITERLNELSGEVARLTAEIAAHEAGGRREQAAALRQQLNLLAGEQSVQQARLYQLRLAAAGSDRDVSVLVPAAVPGGPISPRPLRSGVIGGLVGVLAGLGLAMAREHMGSAVRQVSDIETALAVPVLSTVPRVGKRQLKRAPVAMLDGAHSESAEAYRILRTNLTAAGVGDELRVLVVTSAVSAEGKSTTAANVAASFAEAGVDTLLIDGDLRRPRLHRLFNRSNDRGLSSLLGGRLDANEMRALVNEVRVGPHLSVLPAGPVTERPAQMVVNPHLVSIVRALRTSYLVVIDAPPVLPVADVGPLAAAADSVLIVVRPDFVRKPMLTHLGSRLAQLNAPVLGAVVNAPNRSSFAAGSGYGYYYRGYTGKPSGNGSSGASSKLRRSER